MKDYYGTIKLGKYPQGADGEIKDIEWLILDKSDDKMLVISKYILDFFPTSKKKERVTWETCDLRKWLNDDFIDIAFDDTEKNIILESTVSTDKSMEQAFVIGNETLDRVFVMSNNELYTYFTSNDTRLCINTEFADTQRVKKAKSKLDYVNLNNSWWTRLDSTCMVESNFVFSSGEICEFGKPVNDVCGIRPAIVVSTADFTEPIDENECSVRKENGLYIKNDILTKYDGDDENITIPDGVVSIGVNAVTKRCVKNVIMPDSVVSIQDKAFYCASNLTNINIPKHTQSIGVHAFSCCYALTEVELPYGMKELSENAFYFCKNLKKIIIPDTVTIIDKNAFKLCNELTIYTPIGSYAENYAKENNIPFVEE